MRISPALRGPPPWMQFVERTVGPDRLDRAVRNAEHDRAREGKVSHGLSVQLVAIDQLLTHRCGRDPGPEIEEAEQRRFERACYRMWRELAPINSTLEVARRALFEADDGSFLQEDESGLEERALALVRPLNLLRAAGEKGVPYLALNLMTDTWAGELAARELGGMPSGPQRDRALVEALFVRGDARPHLADLAVPTIARDRLEAAFEDVVVWAASEGLRLQSLYWTALFEEDVSPAAGRRDSPLGTSLMLLYDHDHPAALASGLRSLLDPSVSELPEVERILSEPGVHRALNQIASRPPLNARDPGVF